MDSCHGKHRRKSEDAALRLPDNVGDHFPAHRLVLYQGQMAETQDSGDLSAALGFPKSKHNAKPLRLLKESRSGFYVVFMLVNSIPKTGKSKERLEILPETSIPLHRGFPASVKSKKRGDSAAFCIKGL